VITIAILIILFAAADAILFSKGYYDSGMHGTRFFIRLIVFSAVNYFLYSWSWNWFFAAGLIFASLFDPILNIMRGFNITYSGSGEAIWDRIISEINPKTVLIVRAFVLTVGLYILYK